MRLVQYLGMTMSYFPSDRYSKWDYEIKTLVRNQTRVPLIVFDVGELDNIKGGVSAGVKLKDLLLERLDIPDEASDYDVVLHFSFGDLLLEIKAELKLVHHKEERLLEDVKFRG